MSGSMDHSPADILRNALIDLNQGTRPSSNQNWPIYVSAENSTPDNCITVYDTAGVSNGRTFDGVVLEHPGVQVRIRATTHQIGWTKANSVSMALDSIKLRSVVISGSTYEIHAVTLRQPTFYIGEETPTSKRKIFVINATIALHKIG